MAAVEDSLHHLGLSLDSDKMISTQPRTFDIPIKAALLPIHFDSIQTDLAAKRALFIGHIASHDGTKMLTNAEAIQKGILSKLGPRPAWYTRLKESICTQDSHTLLPHLYVSPQDNETQPLAPSISARQHSPNRKEQYSISYSTPILPDAPRSAQRVTVSDGSMRKNKASFSTLPIQNCSTTSTHRVIGRQE